MFLRQDYIDICEGDHAAALLLAVFEFWHNIRLHQVEQELERAAADPHYKPNTSLWVYKTFEDLSSDLLGQYGRTKIVSAAQLLERLRYVETAENSKNRHDRTKRYRLNPDAVNCSLNRLPQPDNPKTNKSGAPSKSAARSFRNERSSLSKKTVQENTQRSSSIEDNVKFSSSVAGPPEAPTTPRSLNPKTPKPNSTEWWTDGTLQQARSRLHHARFGPHTDRPLPDVQITVRILGKFRSEEDFARWLEDLIERFPPQEAILKVRTWGFYATDADAWEVRKQDLKRESQDRVATLCCHGTPMEACMTCSNDGWSRAEQDTLETAERVLSNPGMYEPEDVELAEQIRAQARRKHTASSSGCEAPPILNSHQRSSYSAEKDGNQLRSAG